MRLSLLFVLGACTTGLVSGLYRPSQTTKPPFAKARPQPELMLRGGAGPLDPTTVAKATTALIGAVGLSNTLCPDAVLKTYGLTVKDKNSIAIKHVGFSQLAVFAGSWALLFENKSANQAMAYAFPFYVLSGLTAMINGDSAKMGTKDTGNVVWCVMNSVLIYALVKNLDWATYYAKAVIGLAFVLCGMTMLTPAQSKKLYGGDGTTATDTAVLFKMQGSILVGGMAMWLALLLGKDVNTAIGYSWIPYILHNLLTLFATKDLDTLKLDKTPTYISTLIAAVVIGTLAF